MTMIAPRPTRSQPRPAPDSALRAQSLAWAMLLVSWQHRQADLAAAAAAEAERAIDAMLVRKIKTARQRVVRARSHAEQAATWNAMRLLIGARSPEQVCRLKVDRSLTR
jgi:hypothetical protein